MLHQIQLLRHLNVLCYNPFGDLRSYHFSFLRVTFSKRYFNVRLGFGVVVVDISLFTSRTRSLRKGNAFSGVCQSVSPSVYRGGGQSLCDHYQWCNGIPPPHHHMDLFTWDPPIPYHLWTPYIGPLTFDWKAFLFSVSCCFHMSGRIERFVLRLRKTFKCLD